MAIRISGVELKDDWRLVYALTHLRGVGWSSSENIVRELKIDRSVRVSDLTDEQVATIASKLENYTIEGDLARQVRSDLQRLKTIGSYRGIRHNKGLPVRGQRTKSNSRSKRGKRRTVGSYKKDVLTKMKQSAPKE